MKHNRDVLDLLAASRPAALAPPPADPEQRYRHLEKAFAQSVQPDRAGRPHRLLHPRGLRRRVMGLGLGLVATGAATAIAIATIGQSGPPNRHHTADQQVGGVNIALAAANQAALQPMAAYWGSDEVEAQSYLVKAETGDYAISAAASEFFQWTSARVDGGNLFYGRDLPARPLTAGDAAAWHRAGAPKTFRVWSNDHYGTYTTTVGDWSADVPQAKPGGRFSFTGFYGSRSARNKPCCSDSSIGATVAQLANLPADPASLTSRYTSAARTRAGIWPVADAVLSEVSEDLQNAPVPPKLRAGMLRMLAALPGLRRIDSVTDPLGRPGFAFAGPGVKSPEGDIRHQVVIFGADGTYLANEDVLVIPGGIYRTAKPGFVIDYDAARTSGWTNTRPKPPTALPHYPF